VSAPNVSVEKLLRAQRSAQPWDAMHTLKLLSLVVIAGFMQTARSADQMDLSCVATEDPDDRIESIRISPSQSRVWIKFKRNDGTNEVPLLYVSPKTIHEPVYAFNRPVAGTDDHVVNAFKVFRVGKQWRLISAGMEARQGTLVLRALGSSLRLDCAEVSPDTLMERPRDE
jgi:hypothetical protein